MPNILRNLLNSIVQPFNAERFHKNLHSNAYFFRGVAPDIVGSFNPEEIDRLLTIQGIGHPNIFLLNSKHGIKKYPFYPYSDGFTRLYSPARVIHEYMTEGTTIMVHNLHNHHPVIAALHAHVREVIKALDNTVCFLTPTNSQATIPHADDHPNLVIQLAGKKLWTIWDIVEEIDIEAAPSVKDLENFLTSKGEEKPPIVKAFLEPGDAVLVPQRFLHTARTFESYSLSIVFQIRCCNESLIAERFLEDKLFLKPKDYGYHAVI